MKDSSRTIKYRMMRFATYPRRDKTFYLIQLQSHYSPAPALTDNAAHISENVNTSKNQLRQKKSHSLWGRIKHYRTQGDGEGGEGGGGEGGEELGSGRAC